MKLSDLKGEKALDALADLLEPVVELMTDNDIVRLFKSGQKIKAVARAIKEHKKAVITILAVTEGADPATYEPNVLSLPAKMLEILNDQELMSLFQSQGQKEKTSSGSAMVNTEAEKL